MPGEVDADDQARVDWNGSEGQAAPGTNPQLEHRCAVV